MQTFITHGVFGCKISIIMHEYRNAKNGQLYKM